VGKSQAKGLNAWDVSNGNDTMISLLNLGENDQDLSITLFFDGGRYKLPVHLKANASTMSNVSDIIMMQQPDSDGNKIPLGTTHGSAVLSGALGYSEWVNVGVSVGVFNVSTATCGNTCPTCFGYSDFYVSADQGTAPVGQDTQFSSWGFDQNGVWEDVTLRSSWSSSNIQVARPSGSTVGAFTGVSPGSFNAQASANLIDVNADCAGNGSPCPFTYWQSSASGTITPVPDHLILVVDQQGVPASCPTTGIQIRQMQMRVVDVNGQTVPNSPSVAETQNPPQPVSSCTGTSPVPASCAPTAADSTFIDNMAVSSNLCTSGIDRSSGCGFSVTSTWSACATSGNKALWVSPRTTESNLVTVDGNSTSFSAGTICDTTGCH
jgi:hypothetical protein